jgi:hypothetical protein
VSRRPPRGAVSGGSTIGPACRRSMACRWVISHRSGARGPFRGGGRARRRSTTRSSALVARRAARHTDATVADRAGRGRSAAARCAGCTAGLLRKCGGRLPSDWRRTVGVGRWSRRIMTEGADHRSVRPRVSVLRTIRVPAGAFIRVSHRPGPAGAGPAGDCTWPRRRSSESTWVACDTRVTVATRMATSPNRT